MIDVSAAVLSARAAEVKGRPGAATMHADQTTDLGRLDLPQPPKRLAVAAFKDVLALSIENKKQ